MKCIGEAWFLGILLVLSGSGLTAQSVAWSTYIDSIGAFSSPRATDLNGDGIQDIILGGGVESAASPNGVLAIDGLNGQILWNLPTRNHIFGTPLLKDLTGDSISEVFITGRGAQFYCLDGRDGTVIWEFWPDSLPPATMGWYQFYSPQWVPDQDMDGWEDLIVTNGGDATALAGDSVRPPGYLLLLSGATGNLIQMDTLPDRHETYHSPLVIQGSGDTEILFGSGGETVRGKYYRILLSEFVSSGLDQAVVRYSDTEKGFIAVPSLADLNADGKYDQILPVHNGALVALDGRTGQEIWKVSRPGTENYVSPVIGQFTGDPTPDAFAIFATGVWPFYSFFEQVLVDGATGQVMWQDTTPTYQLASGNALDWDGDGFDELLLIQNRDAGFYQVKYQNQFWIYDFNDTTFTPFSGPRSGLNVFTTPLITDLEGDGLLDLVYTYHPQVDSWYNFEGFRVERMNLNKSVRPIAWGGYLGSFGDGTYRSAQLSSLSQILPQNTLRVYPNPGTSELIVQSERVPDKIWLTDLQGKIIAYSTQSKRLNTDAVPSGLYLYFILIDGEKTSGKWLRE